MTTETRLVRSVWFAVVMLLMWSFLDWLIGNVRPPQAYTALALGSAFGYWSGARDADKATDDPLPAMPDDSKVEP